MRLSRFHTISASWRGTWLGLAFILLVFLMVIEIEQLSFVLDAGGLATLAVKAGIALAFLAGLLIWDRKDIRDRIDRVKLIALSTLLCLMLSMWVVPFANRIGGYLRKSEPIPLTLISEKAHFSSRFGQPRDLHAANRYVTTVEYLGRSYRLSLRKPLFAGVESGQTVMRPSRLGLWGYRYILPPQ